ncbi:MAG: putative type IV pilin protein [Marinobacter sp. T13-3]|nr:MAG: putative type IV pilin protein [Marinobacter sp. T13-3]
MTKAHNAALMKSSRPSSGQNGFVLTELLLTIGIVAVVLSAIAAVAIATGGSQSAQNEARLMDSAASKIRSLYASRPDYAGLTTEASVQLGAWPESMVAAADDVRNTWGQPVTVENTGAGKRTFDIVWSNVPEESCSDFATAQTSAIGIAVAGTEVYSREPGSAADDPVDVALVAAECNNAPVDITFTFGKI